MLRRRLDQIKVDGSTQRQISRALSGGNQSYVSNLVTGIASLPLANFSKMTEILDIKDKQEQAILFLSAMIAYRNSKVWSGVYLNMKILDQVPPQFEKFALDFETRRSSAPAEQFQ